MKLSSLPDGFEVRVDINGLDEYSYVSIPNLLYMMNVEVIIEGPFRNAQMRNMLTGKEVATSGIMTGRSLCTDFVGVHGPITITDPKNVRHDAKYYIHLTFCCVECKDSNSETSVR